MEGSFLFDMSFHFPIIDRFVIDHCRFDAGTEKNVSINMPYTTFTYIAYTTCSYKRKLYLKLPIVENNTTCWFVHRGGVKDKCAEYEYEYSLQDTRSLLCFIRCKQAEHVRFYNPKNPLPQR